MNDGVIGVYVFDGMTVSFRRIEVIREFDDAYLVSSDVGDASAETGNEGSAQSAPYLSRNEQIITSGKGLYDGAYCRRLGGSINTAPSESVCRAAAGKHCGAKTSAQREGTPARRRKRAQKHGVSAAQYRGGAASSAIGAASVRGPKPQRKF